MSEDDDIAARTGCQVADDRRLHVDGWLMLVHGSALPAFVDAFGLWLDYTPTGVEVSNRRTARRAALSKVPRPEHPFSILNNWT